MIQIEILDGDVVNNGVEYDADRYTQLLSRNHIPKQWRNSDST